MSEISTSIQHQKDQIENEDEFGFDLNDDVNDNINNEKDQKEIHINIKESDENENENEKKEKKEEEEEDKEYQLLVEKEKEKYIEYGKKYSSFKSFIDLLQTLSFDTINFTMNNGDMPTIRCNEFIFEQIFGVDYPPFIFEDVFKTLQPIIASDNSEIVASLKKMPYQQIILNATNVLSNREEYSFNQLTKEEHTFLKTCDSGVPLNPPSIDCLVKYSGDHIIRSRMELQAIFVKTIHIILYFFQNSRRELFSHLSSDDLFTSIHSELNDIKKSNKLVIHRSYQKFLFDLLRGRINDYCLFIYETLIAVSYSSKFSFLIYHQEIERAHLLLATCALDCVYEDTLYVCLYSLEYLANIWWPYISKYYDFSKFDSLSSSSTSTTESENMIFNVSWKKILIYFPQSIELNYHTTLISLAASFFKDRLPEKFRQSLKLDRSSIGYNVFEKIFQQKSSSTSSISSSSSPSSSSSITTILSTSSSFILLNNQNEDLSNSNFPPISSSLNNNIEDDNNDDEDKDKKEEENLTKKRQRYD